MKNIYYLPLIVLLLLSACSRKQDEYFDSGVSQALAEYRKAAVRDIEYDVSFRIPEDKTEPVDASLEIRFHLLDDSRPVLLDFRQPSDFVDEVLVNRSDVPAVVVKDHIRIPEEYLHEGEVNTIEVSFTAGDLSLNRNEEFLYTLFVPDRASTAFPCFDQPNLKALYRLQLDIPVAWEALANNPLVSQEVSEGRKLLQFGEGKPISTYLFAFSAGKFEKVEREVDGIPMILLHRETDEESVERNIDRIFELHAQSIRWLEQYTGIQYPFDKFAFTAIPSFQYGGMEHPGNIFYRSSSLFLSKDPSQNSLLGRAGLIAHETSHMWFGDLVTMDWFDDVWLKEVFAGYMSDKMVNPMFPEINHELDFLLGRYPSAYSVDRTQGANPIIQELDNMKNAGTLYGAIIYNKAPVVMKHLEQILGEEVLQEGLEEYLKTYAYGNARWADLIEILDAATGTDLKGWSHVWVREAGMPEYTVSVQPQDEGSRVEITETDPMGRGRSWPQSLHIFACGREDTIEMNSPLVEGSIQLERNTELQMILPNAGGLAYGYFRLDNSTLNSLLEDLALPEKPVSRAAAWINIREGMIRRDIPYQKVYAALPEALKVEEEDHIIRYLRGLLQQVYWHYMNPRERLEEAPVLENFCLEQMQSSEKASQKKQWYSAYRSVALTREALNRIYRDWQEEKLPPGIRFSESDYIAMAYGLALKMPSRSGEILEQQMTRVKNPDRLEAMHFIAPSLHPEKEERDAFFESLLEPENREHEPWVGQALGYLNHPLRQEEAVEYILPALVELQEIQETGDIFFPGRWLSAILGGHHSNEAADIVRRFLDEHPGYPVNLRMKILQEADHLLREKQ